MSSTAIPQPRSQRHERFSLVVELDTDPPVGLDEVSATRWVKGGLGTKTLAERIAALRCGLGHISLDAWLASESAKTSQAVRPC